MAADVLAKACRLALAQQRFDRAECYGEAPLASTPALAETEEAERQRLAERKRWRERREFRGGESSHRHDRGHSAPGTRPRRPRPVQFVTGWGDPTGRPLLDPPRPAPAWGSGDAPAPIAVAARSSAPVSCTARSTPAQRPGARRRSQRSSPPSSRHGASRPGSRERRDRHSAEDSLRLRSRSRLATDAAGCAARRASLDAGAIRPPLPGVRHRSRPGRGPAGGRAPGQRWPARRLSMFLR